MKEKKQTKKQKKEKVEEEVEVEVEEEEWHKNYPMMRRFGAGWFSVGLQNDKNPRWSMAQAIGSANVPGCHMVGT